MNQFIFNQTGGFPLDTNVLAEMQRAYELLNYATLFKEKYVIIKGCETTNVGSGIQVSDGFLAIDGEVLPFESGVGSAKVIIQEESVSKNFEDGQDRVILKKRKARLGSGSSAINFSKFKRLPNLVKSSVPPGMIAMWAGQVEDIPDGWALCDGDNGTPNLTKRFVLGYAGPLGQEWEIGQTGGEQEVTLTVDQMPSHDHTGTTNKAGSHRHGIPNNSAYTPSQTDYTPGEWGSYKSPDETPHTDYAGEHEHALEIESAGGGKSHNNMPPYYVLAYIQYKG